VKGENNHSSPVARKKKRVGTCLLTRKEKKKEKKRVDVSGLREDEHFKPINSECVPKKTERKGEKKWSYHVNPRGEKRGKGGIRWGLSFVEEAKLHYIFCFLGVGGKNLWRGEE